MTLRMHQTEAVVLSQWLRGWVATQLTPRTALTASQAMLEHLDALDALCARFRDACDAVLNIDETNLMETTLMASRKGGKPVGETPLGAWNGIASVSLESSDGAKVKQLAQDAPRCWAAVEDLIQPDYKLTLSWNERSSTYQASLSCYVREDPNFKYTLIGMGSTPWNALASLAYKHQKVNGVWTNGESTTPDFA